MAVQQPESRGQTEVPISILSWMGMKSNFPASSIPANSFSYCLNADFISPNEITTRMGTTVFMDDTVTGAVNAVVGARNFRRPQDAAGVVIFATSNGKLYSLNTTTGGTPTYIGDLTQSVELREVSMTAFKRKLYLSDGIDAWVYDPDAVPVLQTLTLPFAITANVVDVLVQNSRLWWLSDEDDIVASAPNDPTDYTGDDAWLATISEDDGMSNRTMCKWGKTVVITKHDPETLASTIYKVSGFDVDTFRIDPMYGEAETNPVGFMGRSAIQLGNDVIGLTRDGFTTISAIDTFNETSMNNLSGDIDDVVRRINWDAEHKISAIYDSQTRQYLCACPIDASDTNNIIFVYSPEQKRWGLYDNWKVRKFFLVKDRVFFGSDYGKIVKTRDTESDEGFGYNKILDGPDWHFDSPDTIKLFKSLDLDLTQAGEYKVTLTPVVDGNDLKALSIPLSVKGGALWDVFVWDIDPWDAPLESKRSVSLLLRGKTLRVRISNSEPEQPFSLRSMTIRSFVTDAGSVRTT